MTLFSAADIADLSVLDVSAMNETFTITDEDVSDDGPVGTPGTRTTMGYLWTLNGREAGDDQVRAFGAHRMAIPKTVAIDATDTITQTSTGKVFKVVYPFPVTAYSTSRIIGLEDA